MVNSNVEQDARKALDLLNQCQSLLTAAPKRKGRCEDLKSSIVRDINTIKECQQFTKDINVAVFSKQMGAGKSHIVNSLAIGGDRKYPAMSDVNYGHGVTSIPTRYRYSPTPKFIRHYLSKEQVEERKTLCREWPKMTSNDECNHFINCHVQSIELDGNTKDFFEATWKIQSETLLSELFCILYDEIYFPFELMSRPRYSLMDLPGYEEAKSEHQEFRFCQILSALKYSDTHVIVNVQQKNRGTPTVDSFLLLLALGAFTSDHQFKPCLVHMINFREDLAKKMDYKKKLDDGIVMEDLRTVLQTAFGLKDPEKNFDQLKTELLITRKVMATIDNTYDLYSQVERRATCLIFFDDEGIYPGWTKFVQSINEKIIGFLEQRLMNHSLALLSNLLAPAKKFDWSGSRKTVISKKREEFNKEADEQAKTGENRFLYMIDTVLCQLEDIPMEGDPFGLIMSLSSSVNDCVRGIYIDICDQLKQEIKRGITPRSADNMKEFLEDRAAQFTTDISDSICRQYIDEELEALERLVRRELESINMVDENFSPNEFISKVFAKEVIRNFVFEFANKLKELNPYTDEDGFIGETPLQSLKELQKRLRNQIANKTKPRIESKNSSISHNDELSRTFQRPKRFISERSLKVPNHERIEDLNKCVENGYLKSDSNGFKDVNFYERKPIRAEKSPLPHWVTSPCYKNTIVAISNEENRASEFVSLAYDDRIDKSVAQFSVKGWETDVIPPVFIPTQPREMSDDGEEIVPTIDFLVKLRQLNSDNPNPTKIDIVVFLVFEDRGRLNAYQRSYQDIPQVIFVVIEHDVFNKRSKRPLGIGRKRAFMQIIAEHFRFPFFAVMDDDIGNFEEFLPFKHKNESYPACGVRSLSFLKRILLSEMFPRDQEDDKIANFKQVCGKIIFQFFSTYAAGNQNSKHPADVANLQFQIPSQILSEIHDLAASASTDKCGKIMEYLSTSEIQQYRLEDGTTLKEEIGKEKMFNVSKHIGSAAMINRNSSAYRMSYQRLQNFQQTTHNVSSMIYQCVMFNLDAIHGIYHVPQSVFFSTDHILREERTELSKKCKSSPNNEAGRRLWQLGYKFEDKYYHRQLLLHGVAGFQVYWFSFNNMSNGSLVDGTANSHSRVAQEDSKEAQETIVSEDIEGQSHVALTLDKNGSAASLNKRKDSSEMLPTSRLKHIKLSDQTEAGFNDLSQQESVNKE